MSEKILIVEDESIVALDLRYRLDNLGYEVADIAASGEEAIEKTAELAPDLILMDIQLAGEMDGVEAAAQIRARWGIPVIYITAYAGEETVKRAKVTQPLGYLVKPFDDRDLHTTIEIALYRHRAEIAESKERALAEALRASSAALNSTLDLEEVLDLILINLEQVVAYGESVIFMAEGDEMRSVRERGYDKWGLTDWVLALKWSFRDFPHIQRMWESRKPILIDDVTTEPDWVEVKELSWQRSVIAVPICKDRQVLGFIGLSSAEPGFYVEQDTERLSAFADQVAIALTNARLYQTIQRQVIELEHRNQELDAFSHMIAHDLRSPLQIVLGYAHLFATEYADGLSQDVVTGLEEIANYAQKMEDMVNNLLLLARLRHIDDIEVESVDARPVAQAAVGRFRERADSRGISIRIGDDLPPVMANTIWLEEVFANLVENAVKYIGSQTVNPSVSIIGSRRADMARFEVEDNGIGIAPEKQEQLFAMFSRVHEPTQEDHTGGLGLGLSIVQRIVTRLDGRLGVQSEPGRGSVFWFELPASPE
jgi:signal transduction histidine kinase/DNA-binding NarL/FixJ family response regulator